MRVLVLLFLPACWLSDAEIRGKWQDADTDVDTVADAQTTAILGIEPAFGTDAGGVRVAIEVDAIGPDLAVTFDGAAATVVSADGDVIVVETPPGRAGPVDVEVASGGASGVAEDGFWYWEDGQGQFGTVGAVYWNDYVGDLERLGYVDAGLAWFQLIEPSDTGYEGLFGTGMDRCTNETLDPEHVAIDLGAPDVLLQPEIGGAISLPYDPDYDGYAVELGSGEYFGGVDYRLLPPEGDVPWPTFGIDPVATTPLAFQVTAPDFEFRNLDGTLGQPVGRSFDLAWTTNETADYVVVRMVRWGPGASGVVPVEVARCLLEDDGAFTFPDGVFDDWNAFYPLDIYLGRVSETGTTLPHNRAMNGVTGQYRVAGTVYQAGF